MANLNEITVNAKRILPLKTWGKYSYFKDSNGKGHWNDTSKNERLPNGNRITDKNGNIFQLNSDGSATKMYDATTDNPKLSQFYTMFYKPSAQQQQLVDDHGVNLGQGGAGAFASKENNNGVAIFNKNNPKAGETLSDGRKIEAVNYVGKPITKQSGLDEVLHNISDRNNPANYNRQAKGNKQYIISSYQDKHPTLNSLKQNGYTEALLQNGKYIDITNITDPRDFAKLDLYQTSGRGDFVEKNGTYNSAGNRINGIFRNPKNDKYMVKIQDISGIGSVTGGHNSTMQQIADSDVPSMIVTKEAEITNYKDLQTFLNRYVQSVPNKTMVKSLNVYNDIVKPYMFNKPNFNKLSEMKEDIDNLPEFVRIKNKDIKTYEMVKNPLIDKFNTLTNLAETGVSKTKAPNTQNKINSLAQKLYVINTPKDVTSSFAENKNNKKNELRQYFTFSSPALEENSQAPSNLECYLKAKKYSTQAKEALLNLPTTQFNQYVNNHIIDLSKFRKGGKIQ